MKVAVPQVPKPSTQRAPSEEDIQEQPRPEESQSLKKQESSFADTAQKSIDKTIEVAEKTVKVVDPLHFFAPNGT